MAKNSSSIMLAIGAGIVLLILLTSYNASKSSEAMSANASAGGQAPKKPGYEYVGDHASAPSMQTIHNDAAGGSGSSGQAQQGHGSSAPVGSAGAGSSPASVTDNSPPAQLPPSCSAQPMSNPKDLLPAGGNSFGQPEPPSDTNFLQAGYHIGIDTVGQSLRNANLQVRSEPPNPVTSVGPWMQSTIEPDLMRVPLELGCGDQ